MLTNKERDKMALKLIKMARQLTTWGFVDDYLSQAQEELERMKSCDD